ncbi:hypothetical protein Ddye_010442 [Dipteronia dyeriana]|uniref:Uncharacterized protein n=1 Tax=Dipteronia dyeriana TaxID=168575 RepID=A0AAD9XDA3_9ROSI|nr:hypothetical protein Ddye_010442 [Dipteronia dyeriana]
MIALLNTIYKQYEYAIIGTCLSTLRSGSISLTYYPNFNIPLRDLNLHNCLKIQLQIVGAPMMPNSYMATLHHQISYRLQDHALDLPITGHTEDTIFVKAEREDEVPLSSRFLSSCPEKNSQKSCLSSGSLTIRRPFKTSLLLSPQTPCSPS